MRNFLDRRKFLPIQKKGGICKPLILNNQIRFLSRGSKFIHLTNPSSCWYHEKVR